MRLLAVSPEFPFPPRTGGTLVAYNHLKHLSRSHSIHLVSLGPPQPQGELGQLLDGIEFVAREREWRPARYTRAALSLAIGFPSLSTQPSRRMRRRVRELLQQQRWDAILVFGMHALPYCPPSSHPRVVANIEDPQSIKFARLGRLDVWTGWQRAQWAIFARATRRFERSVLGGLGKVLLLSAADAEDLRARDHYDNLGSVSYGVTPREASEIPPFGRREPGTIVISGNMFHPPNVDGVLHFLKEHLPLVLRDFPSAKLWVVGADPDPRIRGAAAALGERVVITGTVPDVSEYLRRAAVSVCPIRLKIGVQTKILEALSWGTPVVATSAANSGIGARAGREIWVEDEPAAFARRIVALLRGEEWDRLSREGAKLVAERFSWDRSGAQLEEHLAGLRSRRP